MTTVLHNFVSKNPAVQNHNKLDQDNSNVKLYMTVLLPWLTDFSSILILTADTQGPDVADRQ